METWYIAQVWSAVEWCHYLCFTFVKMQCLVVVTAQLWKICKLWYIIVL